MIQLAETATTDLSTAWSTTATRPAITGVSITRPATTRSTTPTNPATAAFATTPSDTEHLGNEIARLAAHIHAAMYRLLVLIREFDEREGWADGFRSCAEWLSWRTGIAAGAAREKVRVARALAELPRVSAEMRRGALSFSKVRAITRVATPENEADLLNVANHATAAQLERIVRAWRRADRLESAEAEAERHRSRVLRIHQDEDGMFEVHGRLSPEVGALLEKAIEWAEDQLYGRASAEDRRQTTVGQRRADAVGLLAERALAQPVSRRVDEVADETADPRSVRAADRYQVVVHVGSEIHDEGPPCVGPEVAAGVPTDSGLHVSAETSKRVACDAAVVVMTHDSTGRTLDVGRRRRTVPAALRRALETRDRSRCRFPGCEVRHTDAHHITHWVDGGHTKLDNLILLCRRHHRSVHEEGWRVELDGIGHAVFRRPDGRRFPAVPEATVPEATAREHAPAERAVSSSEAASALVRTNMALGITPDAWTATSDWGGEPLEVGYAIAALR